MQRAKSIRPKSPRLLDREIAQALVESPRAHAVRVGGGSAAHSAMVEGASGRTGGKRVSHAKKAKSTGRRSKTRHATRKASSDKINIDQLAQLFDLPPFDDVDEMNRDYVMEVGQAAYDSLREYDEDATEDELEAAREKAEMRAQDEVFGKWYDAVERAASNLFEAHHLELQPTGKQGTKERRYEFKIVPEKSWLNSAEKIRQTADGVGYAYVGGDVKEFLRLGPWTAKQAVLEHLGTIASYPAVYGSTSARQLYDAAFR